jgi:hypothetical protein
MRGFRIGKDGTPQLNLTETPHAHLTGGELQLSGPYLI